MNLFDLSFVPSLGGGEGLGGNGSATSPSLPSRRGRDELSFEALDDECDLGFVVVWDLTDVYKQAVDG